MMGFLDPLDGAGVVDIPQVDWSDEFNLYLDRFRLSSTQTAAPEQSATAQNLQTDHDFGEWQLNRTGSGEVSFNQEELFVSNFNTRQESLATASHYDSTSHVLSPTVHSGTDHSLWNFNTPQEPLVTTPYYDSTSSVLSSSVRADDTAVHTGSGIDRWLLNNTNVVVCRETIASTATPSPTQETTIASQVSHSSGPPSTSLPLLYRAHLPRNHDAWLPTQPDIDLGRLQGYHNSKGASGTKKQLLSKIPPKQKADVRLPAQNFTFIAPLPVRSAPSVFNSVNATNAVLSRPVKSIAVAKPGKNQWTMPAWAQTPESHEMANRTSFSKKRLREADNEHQGPTILCQWKSNEDSDSVCGRRFSSERMFFHILSAHPSNESAGTEGRVQCLWHGCQWEKRGISRPCYNNHIKIHCGTSAKKRKTE